MSGLPLCWFSRFIITSNVFLVCSNEYAPTCYPSFASRLLQLVPLTRPSFLPHPLAVTCYLQGSTLPIRPVRQPPNQSARQSVRQTDSLLRLAFPAFLFISFLLFVFVVIVFNANSHLLSCLFCLVFVCHCLCPDTQMFLYLYICVYVYAYIYIYMYTIQAAPSSCCFANICFFWSWFLVSVWAPFVAISSSQVAPCSTSPETPHTAPICWWIVAKLNIECLFILAGKCHARQPASQPATRDHWVRPAKRSSANNLKLMYYLGGNVAQLSQSMTRSSFHPAARLSSLCSANKIKQVASCSDKSCRHNCYFSVAQWKRKFEQTIYKINEALGGNLGA